MAAIWLLSIFYFVMWEDGATYWAGVGSGAISFACYDAPEVARQFPGWMAHPRGLVIEVMPYHRSLWWLRGGSQGSPPCSRALFVPIWIPLFAAGLPSGMLWRAELRRRSRLSLGRCASCGYDRRGIAANAKCPECGTV